MLILPQFQIISRNVIISRHLQNGRSELITFWIVITESNNFYLMSPARHFFITHRFLYFSFYITKPESTSQAKSTKSEYYKTIHTI